MKKWANFLLLWQGQFVSILGDTLYLAVISYLVLEQTGSTIKMSLVTSIGLVARILTGLVAGAIVDNANRKHLLVLLDTIRGITILFAVFGIVVYGRNLFLWVVFAQIVIDICAAIFNPSINAVIPEIVDGSRLIQANSHMTISRFLGKISGNLIFASFFNLALYPFFLTLNGLTYLFSAFTELFIKVPPAQRKADFHSFTDSIKKGYSYVGKTRGLRYFLFLCGIMNIFLCLTEILYIPFFDRSPLGIHTYGYCMGALSFGTIGGAVLTSNPRIKIDAKNWMIFSAIGYFLLVALFPLQTNRFLLILLFAVMGCIDAIIHNIISACLQLNTDKNFRGVVFSLYSLTNNVMKPISISVGGILGEYFPAGRVITVTMILGILTLCLYFRNQELLRFMSLREGTDESLT